jgi:hypothetical protein
MHKTHSYIQCAQIKFLLRPNSTFISGRIEYQKTYEERIFVNGNTLIIEQERQEIGKLN